VREIVARHRFEPRRAFDLGCGNGATVNMLAQLGFEAVGVDPSKSGIEQARRAFPASRFEIGTAYEPLAERYGRFPLVVSLEVVEHCFYPRLFAKTLFELVAPGGVGIVSTPYHGYWKNLALALTGKWDAHLSPLWEGGHVKFFSFASLATLLEDAGFTQISFKRVGRIPAVAKSVVAVVRK
jgi:2-polyprenyl-6-hydroxyphenyl methylase/3-demethylubiquinone-9 3-methyltransferase